MAENFDLLEFVNTHGSDRVMNFIDNLIIEDSVYDEKNEGKVLKKRAQLNKDYGIIDSSAFQDEHAPSEIPNSEETGEEQLIPADDAHMGLSFAPKN